MIYLEYRDGSSEKFWQLELVGSAFTVTFGKIGAAGQSQTKVFDSAQKAEKEAEKAAASKRKKGYVDAEPPADVPVSIKPPVIKTVGEPDAPASGPEPVADDGKWRPWFTESSELAFALDRLADPTAVTKDDWDEDFDDDDNDDNTIDDSSAHSDRQADRSLEERFGAAYRQCDLEAMQAVWQEAAAAQENQQSWLDDGLRHLLEAGIEARFAPLVQWLLEQGAAFPNPADEDEDDDLPANLAYGNDDDDEDEEEDEEAGAPAYFYPNSGPFFGRGFANYFYREYKQAQDPQGVPALYTSLMDKAFAHLADQLELVVRQYRDFVPESGRRRDRFKGFDGLLEHTPIDQDDLGLSTGDVPKEFWCFLLEELRENPTAGQAKDVWTRYLDHAFEDAAEVFADRMRDFADCVRAGEVKEGSDIDDLPEGGIIGKAFISVELDVPNEYWVYVYLRGAERKNPFDFKTPKISGLTTDHLPSYTHLFARAMEKLVADGVFDGLFAWGGFIFKMDEDPNVIGTYVTDREAPARFEARVAELEHMADQCREGYLSGAALTMRTDDALSAFMALLHGLFGPADEERAYALLRSFLYGCVDGESEDKIISQMHRWQDSYVRINFELARFYRENLQIDDAHTCIDKAMRAGYAPAAELKLAMEREAEVRRRLTGKPAAPDDEHAEPDGSCPGTGFDRRGAHQQWGHLAFEEVFTEDDLYLKTDNIVARAWPNGYIYIRFLIEGEAGYGEALDFVNHLLEKCYDDLSGDSEAGFALRVRFLVKPEYMPQMKGAKSRLGETYPHSECHAFFARAVRYPALRKKVMDYCERALDRFDVYLDLSEDNTTVPGTFAATALAFCGKEYLPWVGRYAAATDDEHTYLLPALMLPLVKHYGNDPGLAPAMFEIARHANIDGNFRLPKDFIWSADFMEQVLGHGGAPEDDHRALEDFAIACEHIYGDNVKSSLKKLKGLTATASTQRERQIYADFYNTYLPAAKIWDGDDLEGFDAIDLMAGDTAPAEGGTLEHQDAVISLKEAEARGYTIDASTEEKTMLFFAPACITDHQTIGYVRAQCSNIGRENSKHERDRRCHMLISTGPLCHQFGPWVISTADMPYECGVILYAGKKSKPMILFGEIDALPLGMACRKRWPKVPEDAEALRRKYLLRESAERRSDDGWKEADRFFELDANTGYFYSEWHSCMARRTLEMITPPFGELVYLASRLMLVYLAERRGDAERLAELAETLVALQPEKADYWRQKLEWARAALA